MVFKHPISAGVDPDMLLFPDIYGFEGLPTFPPEIATFRTGALMIFPKFKKWQNYYVTDCQKNHKMLIFWKLGGPSKKFSHFFDTKIYFLPFQPKKGS